jgi:hypothetical protein
VREVSTKTVPSEINDNIKYRAVVVPVASVPVVLKPVPNVIVYELAPDVSIKSWHLRPADGTVVVKVAFALGVTCTFMFVASAIAVVPAVRTANGSSK